MERRMLMRHGSDGVASSDGMGHMRQCRVALPVAECLAAPASPAPAAHSSRMRRILVVDDNADAAYSLAQLLALSGHDALVAHGAAEALRIAADTVPDLIALDIGLPD